MSRPPEPQEILASDSRSLTVWRWPGPADRPLLHWAHATGFHARTYAPLLRPMTDQARVLAWDMRGHGQSRAAGVAADFRGWESYYRDMCALLDATPQRLILAGHSVGATVSLFAAARRPEKVAGLLLVEPVILGRRARFGLAAGKLLGRADHVGLAAAAARRRAAFPGRADARQSYRGRGAFASWPDDWLAAYVEGGFVDTDDGVRLACTPAWESLSFAATEHRPLRALRGLRLPVIALAGEKGSTFPEDSRRTLARRCPQAQIRAVAGSSHFLPMEQPGAVLDALGELIARID